MTLSKWTVDKAHSSVEFTIKHMMFAKVRGSFHDFEADIEADPNDLTSANIFFSVDVASIDTGNNDRDNHLRSADLFDVEKFPKMTFKATNIAKKGDNEYEVTGDLTIRDVTKSETFKVTYEGQGKDPWGNIKFGYSAEGKIKRGDYGLTYNAALETGGVLIGEDVNISIVIEASKAE
jgi:polyisoprenoid-binding protein YceI